MAVPQGPHGPYEPHEETVREQFRLQAETFTDDGFAVAGLDWIIEQLAPAAGEQALDVAAGAGHLGRALAPHVSHVAALDLTPEMLHQGQQLATRDGLRNIGFLAGDASALPWLDGQFDLVVCRLTLHQVGDPATIVEEMVRVTRADGRIGVVDMVAAPDPTVAAETDHLERRRDPSHNQILTAEEIGNLLTTAGSTVRSVSGRDIPVDFEDWMARTDTPEHGRTEIRSRVQDELDGGTQTGLNPAVTDDGSITLTRRWATVRASRH